MQLAGHILPLIGRYGYLVVLFGVMAESAGIPLPGETILIAAGALVRHGVLNPGFASIGSTTFLQFVVVSLLSLGVAAVSLTLLILRSREVSRTLNGGARVA